jgi:cytochrome c
MKSKLLFLFCCSCIFFFGFSYAYAQRIDKVGNNPPKVQIITPKDGDTFYWNSFIRYSIHVTDTEDGNTEYEEISAKEVFLEVTYLPGDFKLIEKTLREKALNPDPIGLTIIETSTCFNCHAVKTKLTGPSFLEISRRYPHNSATVAKLAKKVIKGSSGVWTNTAMPTNPDLGEERSKQVVQWIFKNAEDPNHNYFAGTEGTFKTKARSENGAKGSYILTASCVDHRLKGVQRSNLRGQHTIVLHSK